MIPLTRSPGRWIGFGIVAGLLVLLAGCAVLFRGTTQVVPVGSEPVGAEIFVDGELAGVTPLQLQLQRGRSYNLVVRLGEQERSVRLVSEIDGEGGLWLLADVAPGGVIVGAAALAPRTNSLGDVVLLPVIAGGVVVAVVPTIVDLATGAVAQLTPTEVFIAFDAAAP